MFEKVILAMGLFAFAKEAPKLISDALGIDSGKMKLGIGGKLAAGGALGAAAVSGGMATAAIRNAVHGWNNIAKAEGVANKFKAAGRILPSIVAGSLSAGIRAIPAGFKAKNSQETRAAAGASARAATSARDRREAYRVSHGNNLGGVISGHMGDMVQTSIEWAQGGFEAEEAKVQYYNSVLDAQEKAKTEAEKLRDRNANDIRLTQEIATRIEWKGSSEQVRAYEAAFRNLAGANGDKMSLEAMRSYIDTLSKKDTSRMSPDDLKNFNIAIANYKNMLNQVEKTAWQTMESAAFDATLVTNLGLDANKVLAIKKEIDNLNNIRKSGGESMINPQDFKTFDETLTELERTRDRVSADLEDKKRRREARQKNNSK